MSKITTIAWRELRAYFSSWLAYALLAGWLAIGGIFYVLLLLSATSSSTFSAGNFSMQPMFGNLLVMMLLVVPLISMRLIAEERNLSTLELLFTSPLTEWQVALGKFLGAWAFLGAMLASTAYMPFFATRYGSIDTGPVWGGYIALLCAGAAFAAFGLLCSSLTASQVVAGFLAFGGMVFSWMLAGPGQIMRDNDIAGFISQWSVFFHCQRMLDGAVDTKDVVFFLSVTIFCLFATVRVLESRKWS